MLTRLTLSFFLVLISLNVRAQDVRSQVAEISPSITLDELDKAEAKDNTSLFLQGAKPEWVWGPNDNGHYTITKSFTAQDLKRVLVKASCDNVMTLNANGTKVASSSEWQEPVEVDITKHLKSGENTLSADVDNQGGVAAFLAKIVLEKNDGSKEYIVSNPDWSAVDRDSKETVALKSRGQLGIAPWNNVFDHSSNAGGVPRDTFVLQPGFQVEKLYTVPKEEFGSWVCITTDPQGRIIASDQGDKGLYRITPAKSAGEESKVEKLPLKITSAQGLLFAFDALYISVNGGPGSGLYRAKYDAEADSFGEVEKLHAFRGGGEHGPHALRLAPDGKSIYVIAGNHTDPPFQPIMSSEPQTMGGVRETVLTAKLPEGMSSRILPNWDEDLLLPRQWDANGHARGKVAPGGWIAKTDPDGKTWEIFSVGYRNPYDMDFNADGELFAYDADMEWDVGTPWYRPTRVVHATSGSEFGWRSGTGKWPTYYLDSLPPVVNIGPGSPVGVEFGYGTKFPAKYQKALYLCDWTFGTMYAIHLKPQGSTYVGEKEEFLSRTPLPLTDVTMGNDGAMYFTIGGRGTQSELYRVTYVGDESTEAVDARDTEFADARGARHELEKWHGDNATLETDVDQLHRLGDALEVATKFGEDRALMYASLMTALWHYHNVNQDFDWTQSSTEDLRHGVTMAVVASKVGLKQMKPEILENLSDAEFGSLTKSQQLFYLRALSLVFIRLGAPDEPWQKKFVAKLDPHFPAKSNDVNRELIQMLVFLKSPTVVEKGVALLQKPSGEKDSDLGALLTRNAGYGRAIQAMLDNQPDKPRVAYALALRNATEGWTMESRKAYFEFLDQAKQWSGGNSYRKFIQNIDDEAFLNASEKERLAIEAAGARKPFVMPELPKPAGPGKAWTLEEVRALAGEGLKKGRNFENGEKMFAATRCILCHRFGGDGGATGPDLTQLAGRFNLEALTEAIIDPSKVISDQYKAHIIATNEGKVITGRIVSETEKALTVVTDPEDSTAVADIPRDSIEAMKTAEKSLMPADLLKPLNKDEVLDLLAYLLSRGNPRDPMFRK